MKNWFPNKTCQKCFGYIPWKEMRRIVHFAVLFFLLVVGYYYSYRLLLAKYGEDPEFLQSCPVNAVFDCGLVIHSIYGELFGLPNSLWGMIFYTVIAFFLLFFILQAQPIYLSLATYLVVMGVIFDIYLAYVSWFFVGKFCLFCVYTYGINLLLLIVFGFLAKKEGISMKPNIIWNQWKEGTSINRFAIVGVPLVILVLFIAVCKKPSNEAEAMGNDPNKMLKKIVDDVYAKWQKEPKYAFDLDNEPFKGVDAAPIEIVEFADFNCPHCARLQPTMQYIENAFATSVKIYFKNFPLDNQCNPGVKGTRGGSSCIAAYAYICASNQGKGFDMINNLFSLQKFGLQNQMRITQTAQKMGLNLVEFTKCLKASHTHQKVVSQAEEGNSAGVQGTPTVYINGKKFDFAHNRKVFAAFLQRLLQQNP